MVREEGDFCGQVGIDADVCAGCIPDPAEHVARQQRSQRVLNACDAVLVPSDYWARVMIGSGVNESVVQVNRNGVTQPSPGFSRPAAHGPVRFGFVGGLGHLKGGTLLIAALRSLDRSDYVLKVVDGTRNLGLSSMRLSHWSVPGQVELVPGWNRGGSGRLLRIHRRTAVPVPVAGEFRSHRQGGDPAWRLVCGDCRRRRV